MKLRISTLIVSLFLTSQVTGKDQTDSLNMSGEAVKVIKQYNGRWKGWSDGCINCDMPLTVTEYSKPKAPKKETPPSTQFRAPIKQGYCECRCNPLEKTETKGVEVPKKDQAIEETSKPEKE